MESKLLVSAIFFASWFYVGFSQQEVQAEAELELNCMETLIPCQSALQASSSPPPSTCCTPLKKMVETSDKKCVCGIFGNVPFLKTINVTQEEALKVPKNCGAEVDLSVCKSLEKEAAKSLASATSSTNTTTESASEGGSASSTGTASPATSSAYGLSPFGKNGVILAQMVAWMSIVIGALKV